jgi:hypothetical protein
MGGQGLLVGSQVELFYSHLIRNAGLILTNGETSDTIIAKVRPRDCNGASVPEDEVYMFSSALFVERLQIASSIRDILI